MCIRDSPRTGQKIKSHRPKRDFTRNRKLPFETLCRTILSMNGQSLKVGRVHTASLLAADGSHVQISSNIHDEATYFSSTKNGQPAVESDITHLQEASPCCVAERLTLLPFNLISQAQIQSR